MSLGKQIQICVLLILRCRITLNQGDVNNELNLLRQFQRQHRSLSKPGSGKEPDLFILVGADRNASLFLFPLHLLRRCWEGCAEVLRLISAGRSEYKSDES